MQLAFKTKKLRELCEDVNFAKTELGDVVAEKLKHRIADIWAASTVHDLVAGNPRELGGSQKNQYAIDLDEGCSLFFCAGHTSNPTLSTGEVDWSSVSRVKILRIERDHG